MANNTALLKLRLVTQLPFSNVAQSSVTLAAKFPNHIEQHVQILSPGPFCAKNTYTPLPIRRLMHPRLHFKLWCRSLYPSLSHVAVQDGELSGSCVDAVTWKLELGSVSHPLGTLVDGGGLIKYHQFVILHDSSDGNCSHPQP